MSAMRWRRGWSFERLSDGAVMIQVELRDRTGHVTQVAETVIPGVEWAQLVAGLSADGKKAARAAARALHLGEKEAEGGAQVS